MSNLLKIGSRKSALAKLQSYLVADALKKRFPNIQIEFHFKESLGDKDLISPLWKMGDRGVFTKDFKEDLLNETVDVVIHSWKDLDLAHEDNTEIISILERADQRDLLLFKKEHILNPTYSEIKIFSSSPRREFNLKRFLAKALPKRLQNKPILFEPVRGNMQTRLSKWQENSEVQGLILAKAALDRLLSENFPESSNEEYSQIRKMIRSYLKDAAFMCLPLSENPNAPAQGALAAEVKSSRTDIKQIISTLTIPDVSRSVLIEREELQKYGGGCHQKIGVGSLKRKFGTIFYLRGLTDNGKELNSLTLTKTKNIQPKVQNITDIFPKENEKLKFKREPLDEPDLVGTNFLVARTNAWHPKWTEMNLDHIIWAAGIKTFYQLAEKDLWVSGTSDGLGEDENPNISILLGEEKPFIKLTHEDSSEIHSNLERVFTYKISLDGDIPDLTQRTHFFWMSGHQFDLAFAKFPGLVNKFHACGPGITATHIQKRLGESGNLEIFLNFEEWLDFHNR
ncbi:MAG: hydroxymethylbilane synthase [Leptospiraceae bacterium]|nr:hydroxymethylbilane synthase [Leptospiraceae bacterium]